LRSIADAFQIQQSDITHIHQVEAVPMDLLEHAADIFLVQLAIDRPIASILRFVLVDTEIYFPGDTQPSTYTRRVFWLPTFITRLSLFRLLHLETHCNETPERCHLYVNDYEIEQNDQATIDIEHGDYVSIYIGACNPDVLDAMMEEVTDQEPTVLFQRHHGVPYHTLRSDQTAEPPLPAQLCGERERRPGPPRPTVPRWRTTVQNRFDEEAFTEVEEEGQVAYIVTWYVHHETHPRCDRSRTVRLDQHASRWEEEIIRTWNDLYMNDQPANILHVHPRPVQASTQTVLGHIIVEQGVQHGMTAALATTHRSTREAVVIDQCALVVSDHMTRNSFLRRLQLPRIGPDQWIFCRVHINEIPFGDFDVEPVDPGTHFDVIMPNYRPQIPGEPERHVFLEEHYDATFLMQQDSRTLPATAPASTPTLQAACHDGVDIAIQPNNEPFHFNPFAAEFAMPRPSIRGQTEFVQDLFPIWQTEAFTWAGEVMSCKVAVWYANHHWPIPHGMFYRTVQLYENYQEWEEAIKNVWRDYIDPNAEVMYYLVTPRPPSDTNDITAHVILVQHENPQWITTLVTVLDDDDNRFEPAVQIAATTHEHILLENILIVTDLLQQCIGTQATHDCQAQFQEHVFQPGQPYPGRCGYGIVVRIRTRGHQVPQAMNLLQMSVRTRRTCNNERTQERLTDDSVAHDHRPWEPLTAGQQHGQDEPRQILSLQELIPTTTAVRLIYGDSTGPSPTYLEVAQPGTHSQIEEELVHWGLHCDVFDCAFGNHFLCLPHGYIADPAWIHYVFLHDDPHDAQGCFLHSAEHVLTDPQLMLHLCALEYPRAVIMRNTELCRGWRCIIFHHSEPQVPSTQTKPRSKTPWPQRFRHCKTTAPLIDLKHNESGEAAKCRLDTEFTNHDLSDLFASANGILCADISCLELPDELHQQAMSLTTCELKQPDDLDAYDRLLIFTDGSSQPSMKRLTPQHADAVGSPDTWAFAVVGEQFGVSHNSQLTLFGWAAFPVRYDSDGAAFTGISRIGSDMAERSALIGAGLWRMAQNHAIPTIFCTDAITAGDQAFGRCGADDPDDSYRLMRGIFQFLEMALPPGDLRLHHTKAHAGDIYNEIVDTAAKKEAKASFHMRRQSIHVPHWKHKIQQLWTVCGHRVGLPEWQDGILDVQAPIISSTKAEPAARATNQARRYNFAFSLASANVQSLYKGPDGHAGKLHYLQTQTRAMNINCIAIQEARSEQAMSVNGGILRFCSGHVHGQGGIEVWIDTCIPYAHDDRKKPYYFQKSHFQVVLADERRLLLKGDTGIWKFWVLALHGPHSGHSLSHRTAWWEETHIALRAHVDNAPIFALMDANAAPGARDDEIVFKKGFQTSANTGIFRNFLAANSLCLPATGHTHYGDNATWTSIDGLRQHCIDHIAVPQSWQRRCTWSQVLADFDLATINDDHQPVALQLQLTSMAPAPRSKTMTHGLQRHEDFNDHEDMHAQLLMTPSLKWSTDVETQNQIITAHLHQILVKHKKQGVEKAKKIYVTEEIWALRQVKLDSKGRIKDARRRLKFTAMAVAFNAWKSSQDHTVLPMDASYDTTLRCIMAKLQAQLYAVCRQMKQKLAKSKLHALRAQLDKINSTTPAAEVLRSLPGFTGPTNPKKAQARQLPMVRDQAGVVCLHPEAALDTWITFFQHMEGGTRMSHQELHDIWTQELCHFQQDHYDGKLSQMPSLTDLEIALRRIPRGKARGPDGIPGELCHLHPAAIAKLLYSQLLKTAIHGHEPLAFKGGRLVAVYKGRGPTDQCSSYRSLLISNHLGKALHRTLRVQHAQVYEQFLQAQQTGGRRRIPVQLPLHQARAFIRDARNRQRSSAILYLDLKEAFYRIVREAPLGGEVSDEFVAFLAKRLNLPADALHQLYALLGEPTALQQAGLSDEAQRCLRAVHASTHFWMDGQNDVSRTTVGTRPGDCLADIVFGFAWARVLHKLQAYMEHIGALSHFHTHEHLPLFGHFPVQQEMVPFLGPTWMDDVAVCITSSTPETLVSQAGAVTGYLLDLCEFHCMQPNLDRGKTELMMTFRGRGSRAYRIQYYGPAAPHQLPIVREHGICHIQLISNYKHLGGALHHTGDQNNEIQQKAAIGHAAFNRHRKILYQNHAIDISKRTELFQMLVLSKMMYGAETWIAMDARTMRKFHAVIMRLYKRLLPPQLATDHLTDDEVLVQVAQLSPLELLHRARLRYFVTLVHCRLTDIWAIFATDEHWTAMLEQAMVWMWEQLQRSSSLPDPRLAYPSWLQLVQQSPKYWKRLIRRACEHSILQRAKRLQVCKFHEEALVRLEEACVAIPPQMQTHVDERVDKAYGCMRCQIKCNNRAGEAAHMFRRHGQVSRLRRLFAQPTCAACLKYFHTNAKMKAHLYYSNECRRKLESLNMHCDIMPGTGSQDDRVREAHHDRVLPPLQSQGPQCLSPRRRDVIEYNEEIYDFLIAAITEKPALTTFWLDVKTFVESVNVSWTDLCTTLQFFIENVAIEDAQMFGFNMEQLRYHCTELIKIQNWDFLRENLSKANRKKDIKDYELQRTEVKEHITEHGAIIAPRQFGRIRILLHAYSGRRRVGDLQYYLDIFASQRTAYTVLVVSLDIVVDAQWGDAANPATRTYWIQAVRDRYVIGFVGGPPCETWSRARGKTTDTSIAEGREPRVLRDLSQLWGFDHTTLREVQQIIMGNTLLCFALWIVLEIALTDGLAVLEHPAEPDDDPALASIWRLPFVEMLLALPNVQKIRFAQGLLGSFAPKPTHLLVVNLPDLLMELHRHRVRKELPKARAIGRNAQGQWKTTVLKEYAPAFCMSMATAIITALDASPVPVQMQDLPPPFVQRCKDMTCTEYGQTVGADYAF